MTGAETPAVPPAIVWAWPRVLLGALFVAPAALVALADTSAGLALAVGLVPACVTELAPTRRGRRSTALLGVLVGVPIFLGALVAQEPWLAVLTLFASAIAAVLVARGRPRLGVVLTSLGLPMIGVGLSYTDLGEAAALAGLMVVGSLWACLVAMLWPETAPRAGRAASGGPVSVEYGIRLGLTGATAATIGFALDLDHVGWATAASLLVMRPSAEMQRLRSVGRLIAVAAGALTAGALANLTSSSVAYSVAIVIVIALAAATQGSRWYVTPAFTTFLALSLLVSAQPESALSRFNERVVETALGVALAYFYGLLLPAVLHSRDCIGPSS